jgi:hypothetical protein
MKRTDRRRLELKRDAVRILSDVPYAALRQVRGGADKTTPEGGCASTTGHSSVPPEVVHSRPTERS